MTQDLLPSDEGSGNGSDDGAGRYMVPALERGLRLLQEFGLGDRTLGAPELARRLALPRATVFRLLNTLESMNFLERSGGGNEYRLGMAVLRLGFEYLSSLDLTELGQPVIARLCDEVRYPCNIVVRDNRSIVYVAKVTPPVPLASAVHVGTRLPAHSTAFGRVLLSEMPLSELRALYPEEHLEIFSSNTPKTVLDLFDIIEADRERGYVFAEGFYEASISTIAAPVRDHGGGIVAALGVTITAPHVNQTQAAFLVDRVRAAADELSGLLNYRPQTQTGARILSMRER